MMVSLVSPLVLFLLTGIAGWSAWVSLFVLLAVAVGLRTWSIQTYPQRQQNYQQKKQQHSSETIRYQQALAAMPERKQQYQVELKNHTRKVKRLKAEHANSAETAIFRSDRLRQVLNNTKSYDGTDSKAPLGRSEAKLNKYLYRYFGSNIYTKLTLTIPNYEYPYSPDFAYIDRSLNLHIDIEVDEPYSYSEKPIHYIGKDELRNRFFLQKGWLVIRFCEQQVEKHPDRCCKMVAQVISEVSGDHSLLKSFFGIDDLEPLPQWTYDEAEQMCKDRVRDR